MQVLLADMMKLDARHASFEKREKTLDRVRADYVAPSRRTY